MVGDIIYSSIREYSPDFYQPSVGMSAPLVAAFDHALCEEVSATGCHLLCCFLPTSE